MNHQLVNGRSTHSTPRPREGRGKETRVGKKQSNQQNPDVSFQLVDADKNKPEIQTQENIPENCDMHEESFVDPRGLKRKRNDGRASRGSSSGSGSGTMQDSATHSTSKSNTTSPPSAKEKQPEKHRHLEKSNNKEYIEPKPVRRNLFKENPITPVFLEYPVILEDTKEGPATFRALGLRRFKTIQTAVSPSPGGREMGGRLQ